MRDLPFVGRISDTLRATQAWIALCPASYVRSGLRAQDISHPAFDSDFVRNMPGIAGKT
jgi:hypothetical protein